MNICLKSILFKDGTLIKNFDQNFNRLTIKENKWQIETDTTNGTIKDIELNKAYILLHDLKNSENLEIEVLNSEPLFKLHFEFEGCVNYSFQNKKNSTLKVGQGYYNLFYLPESLRKYSYNNHNKKSLEIFFCESYLQNIMGYCFTGTSQRLINAKVNHNPYAFFMDGVLVNEQIMTIIKEIENCSYSKIMKKAFLEAKIIELLLITLTNTTQKKSVSEINNTDKYCLKIVEKHIKLNLKKELTIPDLALLAGVNTSKLKKDFKQVYSTTIFKYITALRIQKAKDLIQKENHTISQASYEVGYKNPQHFTVAFKKKLGYLPSQLKKNSS